MDETGKDNSKDETQDSSQDASQMAKPRAADAVPTVSKLAALDTMMAEHVWHPRFIPFLAYLLLLTITGFVSESWAWTYPFFYVLQCSVVVWMLWRYRKLIPELTIKFHWLAIPVGVGVAYAWIWIGMVIEESAQVSHDGLGTFTQNLNQFILTPESANVLPGPTAESFHFQDINNSTEKMFDQINGVSPALYWTAFVLRLIGMSLIVPLFEELFIRSLILRSMSNLKQTGTGIMQLLLDFPGIGDKLMNTQAGQRSENAPPMFTKQFNETRLGKLTVFGVFASTLIFAVNHVPRDYLGCVMCGLAYCLLLAATYKKGLGPVCWAHGITNACLWYYTLHTDDWRFL